MTSLHHRCHEEVQKYWEDLRGTRQFPSESEIDSEALGEFWPSCFLVSIDNVTHRLGYRYSYLGQDLIHAYGEDATASDAMRLLSTRDMPLVKQLDAVRESGKPLIDEGQFTNSSGVHIRYRAAMLPFGHDEGIVSYILGCMRWKMY